ncbi:MAG: hypothetical protein AAF213_03575, partial [Pseudomonadota bacterium]
MAKTLTPDDVDQLIARSVSALPGDPGDPLRLLQETATEWLIDDLAQALLNREMPDLALIEQRILEGLDDQDVPEWLTMSRVVLVVRDAMATSAFTAAIGRLPAKYRYRFYDDWANFAARLYQDYPDEQIAGRPAVALNLLAGQSKALRKALGNALSLELHGRAQSSWWDGLRNLAARNVPTQPRPQAAHQVTHQPPAMKPLNPQMAPQAEIIVEDDRPAVQANTDARADGATGQPVFDAERGIKRPSGTPRLSVKSRQADASASPAPTAPAVPSRQPSLAYRQPTAPTERDMADKPTQSSAPNGARGVNRSHGHAEAAARPTKTVARAPAKAKGPAKARNAGQPVDRRAAQPKARVATKRKVIRPDQPRNQVATQRRNPTPRGLRAFEATIEERFESRGLAPIAVTAASMAAIVMAEKVQNGNAPEFYEVEYEVLARSGEAVAPGAVRTWTLHAFMECMRDEWFRELFHALPSQARAETVWVWAKAAAEWFDVPVKLREFWVRALSGGDPVLAAAAARAFAAKTPQLPTRPASPSLPAPPPTAFSSPRVEITKPAPMADTPATTSATAQAMPASSTQLVQHMHAQAHSNTVNVGQAPAAHQPMATAMNSTVPTTVPSTMGHGHASQGRATQGHGQPQAVTPVIDGEALTQTQALGPQPQAVSTPKATPSRGMPTPSAGLMMGRRPQPINLTMDQVRQPQHMPAKPAHATGIFERQTPRPTPAAADQAPTATMPMGNPVASPMHTNATTTGAMTTSAGKTATMEATTVVAPSAGPTGQARPLPKRLGMPPMPKRVGPACFFDAPIRCHRAHANRHCNCHQLPQP